ncbi:hypothetical protein CPB85DRAFT_1436841 [Mucidula mucida]|nr:hypothetical protein CPB85DRAFT_1436841 [Mucidula mucida]
MSTAPLLSCQEIKARGSALTAEYFNEDDGFLNSQVTETQALHLEEEMPTLSYGQDDAKLEIDDHQSELPALDSGKNLDPMPADETKKNIAHDSPDENAKPSHQPLTVVHGLESSAAQAAVFLQGQRLESYHDSVMAELRRIGRRPSVSPEPFLLCGYSETGGSYHFEPNQESQNVIWHRPVSEEPVSRSPSLTVEDINEVDLYVPSVESQQYAVISDGLPHMKGDLPLGYA